MFKQKIKTELEVFCEQRYKDAAVVIYHQLKKRKHDVPNEKPVEPPVQGWTDNTDTVSPIQSINNTSQSGKEIVEYAPGQVQSKFCTLV